MIGCASMMPQMRSSSFPWVCSFSGSSGGTCFCLLPFFAQFVIGSFRFVVILVACRLSIYYNEMKKHHRNMRVSYLLRSIGSNTPSLATLKRPDPLLIPRCLRRGCYYIVGFLFLIIPLYGYKYCIQSEFMAFFSNTNGNL